MVKISLALSCQERTPFEANQKEKKTLKLHMEEINPNGMALRLQLSIVYISDISSSMLCWLL